MGNNQDYINEYIKEHYKQLRIWLTPEEYQKVLELKEKLGFKSLRELILYLIKKSS